jgi:hypothetical protein
MSAAGTPVSISASEVQFCPLLLVKNRLPDPLAGTVKLKVSPVILLHPPTGHTAELPPAPWMMICGSPIPSANAMTDPRTSNIKTAKTREIFMIVSCSPKDFAG